MKAQALQLYFQKSRDPVANFLFVLPLLLLYGVGVIFVDPRAFNGADFITGFLYRSLGTQGLALVYAILAAGLVLGVRRTDRTGSFPKRFYGFILLESLIYASLLGETTLRILWHLGLLGPSDPILGLPLPTRLLVSLGAGVNEELVFRLLLIGACLHPAKKLLKLGHATTLTLLIVASSILFSAAHFLSEPFDFHRLVFRWVAGMLFALLYWFRGFSVAVYTHALYDIHVLIFSGS